MERLLPQASFTTSELPPSARYEAWRDLISAVYDPILPDEHAGRDFRAEVSSVNFGHVLITHARAESQHFTRTQRMISVEGLDHYMIQLYRHGECEGTYGEAQSIVRPGDIKLFDLARPFHSFNTDFDNTTLTVPRAALAPLLERPDGLHGLVLAGGSPMARVIGAHIAALSEAAGELTPAEGMALAAATVRLVAACVGASSQARDETRPYRAAAVGQTVRDFIDQHIGSPQLSPDMLARRFRMSRTQIYRLFADEGGVAAYIQVRRLHRCLLALTDSAQAGRGIGEIAFSHGFTSEAHFSRAFRRAFGVTPREARAGAALARPASGETFITDWMRGLRHGFNAGK